MKKDAIIILGAGIHTDGSLPDIPKLRVGKGVELFKNGLAERIIVSGNYGFWLENPPSRSESAAMKEYAITQGIPSSAILEETESKDTVGNAYFCRIRFLEPNNWKNIIVVTTDYHMPRTQYIFDKILGKEYQVQYVSAESNLLPEQIEARVVKENKSLETLKGWYETMQAGDLQAIEKLLFTVHPGYAENPTVTKEQLLEMLGRK